MAKKRIKAEENPNKCDSCKYCLWHTQYWNLDPLGQPITFECRLKVFEGADLRGRGACNKWEDKNGQGSNTR